MKSTVRFGAVLASVWAVAVAGPVSAQIQAETFSINPHAGVHVFDDDQDLDTSGVYGVGLGYAFTEHWGIEGIFDYSNPDVDKGSGDVDVFRYGLDGLYHFRPDKKLVPYLSIGGGAMTFDPSAGGNSTDPQANAGGGVKYFVSKSVALRADGRYLVSFDETNHNFLGTLGLTYVFGAGDRSDPAPKPVTEVVAAVVSLDGDGDGINDDVDQCPVTRRGVTTDANGCAVRMDNDGDGVADGTDQCASTPAGTAVDSNGCPQDGDSDGVADGTDRCAGTPKGATVDERGCWVLQAVRFESSKATLQSGSTATLSAAVGVLNMNSNLQVEIQGYSDNTGSEAFNRSLSAKRAEAVRDYFVSEGIAASRLSHKGFGPENPVASNDTAEGRAKNRRVEMKPLR
ncbi:MAG: OOP family OmpA-OmpF porin [Hyphomicrobiaceae bacterium]|jgi:OOP family OmpA-OmpF porin